MDYSETHYGSKDVVKAAIMIALTNDREEERELKRNF